MFNKIAPTSRRFQWNGLTIGKHLATQQSLLEDWVETTRPRSDLARHSGFPQPRNEHFLLSRRMLQSMQKLAVLSLILLGAVEIREGQTFRNDLNDNLEFVLGLPGSFQVEIKHAETPCKQLFWVADPPFHTHRPTEIDAQYDWTAEQEVETLPREFRFATSCDAYRSLFQRTPAQNTLHPRQHRVSAHRDHKPGVSLQDTIRTCCHCIQRNGEAFARAQRSVTIPARRVVKL
jgi:hypothetical protein